MEELPWSLKESQLYEETLVVFKEVPGVFVVGKMSFEEIKVKQIMGSLKMYEEILEDCFFIIIISLML